ncbi:MAG: diguanylate cyclase [Anaerolineales bacterium]|nr:diguanylate cyclase [Anaerolineales bacterium]
MSNLKQSIVTLFVFVVALLGISNVENFQESIIDFSPVFFVLIAIILFSELIIVGRLTKAGVRLSQYAVIAFWLMVYILAWVFYLGAEKSIEVNLIQLLLVLLTAVLAFDVGQRTDQTEIALEGLASSAFPNRALEIQAARDFISAEITRSRRYHHPLSVLTVRLEKNKSWGDLKEMELLSNEILERFAIAKVSQILSNHARSTDMVIRDRDGQFILMCPESNQTSTSILAKRIAEAVKTELDAHIECGSASFPDEALTFEDLLNIAGERRTSVVTEEEQQVSKLA